MIENSDLNVSIRDWYMKEYPEDNLGKEIPEKYSLLDVAVMPSLVYSYLGEAADSIVRERIFEKVAGELNVDYNVIYQRWLNEVTKR